MPATGEKWLALLARAVDNLLFRGGCAAIRRA